MENLHMFDDDFKIDDKSIIEELVACPMGELLPGHSSGKYFGQKVEFEGHFELLRNDNGFVVCYCDNDLAISDLDLHDSGIIVIPDKDRIIFKIIGRNDSDDLTMIFKNNHQLNIDALRSIKENKEIELYLLAMVFGGFSKEDHRVFKLSDAELEKITV